MPKNIKTESDSVEKDSSILNEACDNKEKAVPVKDLQKDVRKQHLEEKQKQKIAEKLKKDAEKKQKEEEKKRKELEKENEKKKREIEKEEERKKRELEKKQKEIEKEEEKRKKEEERKLKEIEKEEEKRKKEEERKKREEEKRKEEEEKNKKLEKQRAILMGYLRKEKNEQDLPDVVHDLQIVGSFKPIEIKKDMKISPMERIKKKLIKSLVDFHNYPETYLNELTAKKAGNGICQKTWSIPEPEVELATSIRLKTKTFLFLENIRPAYFGTWRKKSEIITPLTPLAEDKTFFAYDLDSDQEWEYESGEDIASSDNEEDEEINEEPEDISFLVPHGYLSDDEDIIDADPGEELPVSNKINKPLTNETKQIMIDIREKQFQAEVKQQVHQINPNIIGPHFIKHDASNSASTAYELYRMVCRNGEGFPINCNLQSDYDNTTTNYKMKGVPPEAVPHIIRLVHCNQLSRAKLCYEFRMFWEYNLTKKVPDVTFENDSLGKDWDEFSIGKKRFTDKLREIAEWKDSMWVVKSEVIQEYQLCCINDDPQKPCAEKWKYVSEVLSIDTKKPSKKPKKRKVESQLLTSVNEKLSKFENDTKLLLEKSK